MTNQFKKRIDTLNEQILVHSFLISMPLIRNLPVVDLPVQHIQVKCGIGIIRTHLFYRCLFRFQLHGIPLDH